MSGSRRIVDAAARLAARRRAIEAHRDTAAFRASIRAGDVPAPERALARSQLSDFKPHSGAATFPLETPRRNGGPSRGHHRLPGAPGTGRGFELFAFFQSRPV